MAKCPYCEKNIEISICIVCGEMFAHELGRNIEVCSKECEKMRERL